MAKLLAKLFGGLSGSHQPDIETLSAHADGRLDAAAARELEAHVAGCDACATRLAEFRALRSTLAALPRAEAPRSFRLRQADVEAPARQRPAGGAPVSGRGVMAFAPVASAVFVMAFALVLGTDLATRDGGDSGANSALTAQYDADGAASAERSTGMAAGDDGDAPDGQPPAVDSGEDAAGGEAATGPVDEQAPAPSMAAGAAAPATDREATAAAERELQTLASEMRAVEDDDDGTRSAFLVAEIITGAAALAAVGWFIASRVARRSEGV